MRDAATRLPALLACQADVMGELPMTDAQQISTRRRTPNRFKLYPVAVPGEVGPVLPEHRGWRRSTT